MRNPSVLPLACVVGFWGFGMYGIGILRVQYDYSFVDALVVMALFMAVASYVLGRLILRLETQAVLCATIAFSTIVDLLTVTEKWLTFGMVGLGTIAYPIRIGWATEFLYFLFRCLANCSCSKANTINFYSSRSFSEEGITHQPWR